MTQSDIRTPENEVMSITLYRTDPYCVEYAFGIKAKTEQDDPQHLEKVNIILDLMKNYRKKIERVVLAKVINISRDVRQKMKEEAAVEEQKAMVVIKPTEH